MPVILPQLEVSVACTSLIVVILEKLFVFIDFSKMLLYFVR